MQRTYNIADLIELVAEAIPDRTAVVYGNFSATYAELNRRADALAAQMQSKGIGKGDTVGLQLYNGPEYLEGFLAACKLGAAPVNVNFRYVADELRYLYDNAQLKGLIYSQSLAPQVTPLLAEFPQITFSVASGVDYEELLSSAGALHPVQRSDDDLILLYTGGTTGKPKGVMWPHRSLFFGALGGGGFFRAEGPIKTPEEIGEVARNGHPLRFFAIAPLMHGAALWSTLASMLAGQTAVLRTELEFDAEVIWDLTAQQKVSLMTIVGDAMAMPLLDALVDNPGRWDLSALMVVGSGGGLFSSHVQEGLRAQLPHVRIADSMGSSEGGVLGTGGRPADGIGLIQLPARPDLGVADDELSRLLPAGEEGYLVRSGYVPVGYFGDAQKSAETFFELDGTRYVNTGDRARQLEDGSFVVLGRGSQCINTGGEKVHVEEVEEVLHRCPGVRDALVTGMPDPRWGNIVSAVVCLKPGHTFDSEAIRTFCREYLASYKVPRHIALCEEVSRSPAGKADYRWAKQFLEEQLAEQVTA